MNRTYGVVKGRLQANVRQAKEQRAVEINTRAKGGWRDLHGQQRRDRANFEAAERGTLSKLWSMAFVFQALRQRNPEADALTIFWVLFSSAQRRAAFEGQQEAERRDFSRQIRREVAAEQRKIDTAADRDFTKLRTEFGGRRGSAGAAAACATTTATADRRTPVIRCRAVPKGSVGNPAIIPAKGIRSCLD